MLLPVGLGSLKTRATLHVPCVSWTSVAATQGGVEIRRGCGQLWGGGAPGWPSKEGGVRQVTAEAGPLALASGHRAPWRSSRSFAGRRVWSRGRIRVWRHVRGRREKGLRVVTTDGRALCAHRMGEGAPGGEPEGTSGVSAEPRGRRQGCSEGCDVVCQVVRTGRNQEWGVVKCGCQVARGPQVSFENTHLPSCLIGSQHFLPSGVAAPTKSSRTRWCPGLSAVPVLSARTPSSLQVYTASEHGCQSSESSLLERRPQAVSAPWERPAGHKQPAAPHGHCASAT